MACAIVSRAWRSALLGALVAVAAIGCRTEKLQSADVIVTGARVWTVDPERPEAEAVAIRGDRIAAVGSAEEIARHRGERTVVVEAPGRFLMPGFNDAHVHITMAGAAMDEVDLRDATTPEEFMRRIAERAKTTPPGEWITGGHWDEQEWPGGKMPDRRMLDAAAPDTPVFVYRHDLHTGVANSSALRLARLDRTTPHVAGGFIGRDERGELDGIFKEAARRLVEAAIPPPSENVRARRVKRALQHMAEVGVTSVQDMRPERPFIDLYAAMAARGELTTRIRAMRRETELAAELSKGGIQKPAPSPFLRVSGAKGYVDGALGARTAFFSLPYIDDPTTSGLLTDEMQPLDGMRSRLLALDAAGEQLLAHAIGDRAISMMLDLLADIERADGQRDRRPRIEHAQHMAKPDFDRFARMGVIASIQPYHAIDDGRWAETRIGAERLEGTYAFKSFLDHGVRLALGTDWPVAPLNPMLTLYAGATRATLDGKHPNGWIPEQKLTVAQLIESYTMGSAYAEFEEREKGSIATGKLADLVLLDADPLRVAPEAISRIKVALTMTGGTIVYDAVGASRKTQQGQD